MRVKNDHRSKFSNLSNWKEEAGALLYQLSYEATHWERGQYIEFKSPKKKLGLQPRSQCVAS